jgi:hypothetical protein
MKTTLTILIFASCLLAAGVLFGRQAGGDPPARPPRLRVGVYDSRAVAVAAVRSGIASRQVQELQEQLKQAEADGDDQRIQQVKKRGEALQTLRHLQGFSNAPIDDILAELKDRLPAIAREAQVELIVGHVDYQAPGVEVVDVTDRLVGQFNPDEQTKQIIASMHDKKPVDMIDVLMHGD